jgi:hypothetical protein
MMSDFKNAHEAVRRAIKSGKLPPIDSVLCADCGKNQAEEYHHYNGYGKKYQLDVTPLCLACHGKTRQVPKESPRLYQCEAAANGGQRCTNWAMKDSIYCAGHTKQAKRLIHYTEIAH